jgi:hypothetical protein
VRKQVNLSRVETDALERRVRVLQNAEAQRQRNRLLEQEEMDINRRELQKAQSLQVRICFIMLMFERTCLFYGPH